MVGFGFHQDNLHAKWGAFWSLQGLTGAGMNILFSQVSRIRTCTDMRIFMKNEQKDAEEEKLSKNLSKNEEILSLKLAKIRKHI